MLQGNDGFDNAFALSRSERCIAIYVAIAFMLASEVLGREFALSEEIHGGSHKLRIQDFQCVEGIQCFRRP